MWKIPRLEDLTVGQRLVTTAVIIVVVVFVLFVIGLFAVEGQSIRDIQVPARFEDRLIKLDREAIDEAYKKHVVRLFDIWVMDYSSSIGQPPRAVKGANNARGAYIQSMTAIEKRETEIKPPLPQPRPPDDAK